MTHTAQGSAECKLESPPCSFLRKLRNLHVELTLTLGEDVSVEVLLVVGAARRQVAQLPALHRGRRGDRQGQRRLRERRLHVGEVQAVGGFTVQLEDFIPCVQTCGSRDHHQLWIQFTPSHTSLDNQFPPPPPNVTVTTNHLFFSVD